jgi:putative ABC transport system permease protein
VNALKQNFVVCAIGLRTLPERGSTALVIIVGTACVVGVLLSMLSVTVGMTRAFEAGGDASRAIVRTQGTIREWGTELSRAEVGTIMNAPGIARGSDGRPLADAEMVMSLLPPKGFVQGSLQLRIFGRAGTALHPQFRILSGRMFRAGAQEVVVGIAAARRFGFAAGGKVVMPGGEWPIVGVFSSGGELLESRFVGDAETVLSTARLNGFSSVVAQLVDASAYPAFEAWLTTNPTLTVDVERQTDFNARQAGREAQLFTRISYGIGVIMGLGALFGTVKIMYAAVRARTREIGTLRALGFGGVPVAVSVLLESMLLSLAGAALGGVIAWLIFDGREFYSWGAYQFRVSPALLALGLGWGLIIALLGGLPPALRAARLPTVEVLRAA